MSSQDDLDGLVPADATLEELMANIPLNNKCKDFIHNVLYRRDLVAPNPVLPFVDRDTMYDEADAADHHDAIPHDEDGAPSGDEDEESDADNEDAAHKDPARPSPEKRQKRPGTTGTDATPSVLLTALKNRFNNELQQFLIALIELHLSGTNATFSAYWNQADVLIPFFEYLTVQNDEKNEFEKYGDGIRLTQPDKPTSFAPCLLAKHKGHKLLQAQLTWMLSAKGAYPQTLANLAKGPNTRYRKDDIKYVELETAGLGVDPSSLDLPGLYFVNPFGTFGRIGVTFTMGLAIKTDKCWLGAKPTSGKRAVVAKAFGWPNKISALLWIDTASMGYLPDIPVPMGAFYGAESIAIITTGASATSEQALAALVASIKDASGQEREPKTGKIHGLNSRIMNPGCPLVKSAGISIDAAVVIVDKVYELGEQHVYLPRIRRGDEAVRQLYVDHFKGALSPDTGAATIQSYMLFQRRVFMRAIDVWSRKHPTRTFSTYFVGAVGYTRYRESLEARGSAERCRWVVRP